MFKLLNAKLWKILWKKAYFWNVYRLVLIMSFVYLKFFFVTLQIMLFALLFEVWFFFFTCICNQKSGQAIVLLRSEKPERHVRNASHRDSKQQYRSCAAISLLTACSRHTYIVLFFAHIPFVVNHTINATSPERLQQYNDQTTFYLFSSLRPAQDKSAFQLKKYI